jgi:hypothetical protein
MAKHIRKSRNQLTRDGDLKRIVNILLASDRAVVEFNMNLYNVHGGDRLVIREQKGRLHDALKDRILGPVRAHDAQVRVL